MNDHHTPGHGRRIRRRLGLPAAAGVIAGLGSAAVVASMGALHLGHAQVASPTPTGAPWAPPTHPPMQYAAPAWLDPSGQALAARAPGSITAPCTHDNFALHVAPLLPSSPRNTPVVLQYSIVFTGPHPCHIEGETVPTVRVFDNAHDFIWVSDGKYGGGLAHIPAAQLTAAGDALTGDVAWGQEMCVFGNCPQTEVPPGTYSAEVWFWPYGQSQPAPIHLTS